MRTINTQNYTRGQSFITQEIRENKNPAKRFRFTVRTDTHHPQAFARAEVFNREPADWVTIYEIPGELLQVDRSIAYANIGTAAKAARCKNDIDRLVTITREIMGWTVD